MKIFLVNFIDMVRIYDKISPNIIIPENGGLYYA